MPFITVASGPEQIPMDNTAGHNLRSLPRFLI
jgi:hypothetical protein